MNTVYTFLADGFETVEALAVVDILRRAGIDTVTVSITNDYNVCSAQNITVKADELIDNINFDKGSMIFIPGGLPGTTNLADCKKLEKHIIEYNDDGRRLAAICAGPSVFGNLGLLKGKRATCYPGFEKTLVGAETGGRVVTDGNITTAIGMGAAVELGLELVKILRDGKASDDIKRGIQCKM